MKFTTALFVVLAFFASCGQNSEKKNSTKEKTKVGQQVNENENEYRLRTGTGKEFIVKTHSTSASLNDITIVPKGFDEVNEPINIKDADPVTNVFTADVNGDGFDELYIITTSAGSGSYGTIYAFSSNKDKSVTPVYVKELPEKEQEKVFKGYMGHDSVYVSGNRLYCKYPVYKDGDANCCPSGGTKVIEYVLRPGEASWILEVKNN